MPKWLSARARSGRGKPFLEAAGPLDFRPSGQYVRKPQYALARVLVYKSSFLCRPRQLSFNGQPDKLGPVAMGWVV